MRERTEILLREYENCQSHVNALSNQYWIAGGVFVAVNTALLGAILVGVFQARIDIQNICLSPIAVPSAIVLVLGLAMIIILKALLKWNKRGRSTILICYERMREIEAELGMWRGWIIHGLDGMEKEKKQCTYNFDTNKLALVCDAGSAIKDSLTRYHPLEWWQALRRKSFYAPPKGFKSVQCIFYTLMVVWSVIVVAALAVLCCVFFLGN